MSDDDKKPARKPLTLKGAQPGEVKQTFSHGRTNKVAVEVKRRRKLGFEQGFAGYDKFHVMVS